MTRRLVLSYLAIAVFVLAVLEIPLGISFARTELERLTVDLERDAIVIGSRVEDTLQAGRSDVEPRLDEYLAEGGDDAEIRVVITDADGISVYDSGDPSGQRRDFSTRPEIVQALAGQRAAGTRPSETLGNTLLYVAIPVASGGAVHGVVRITYPTTELDRRVQRNWLVLGGIAIIVLTATTAVGWGLARWVGGPVRTVTQAATDLAGGDLDARANVERGPPEVRELAGRFNSMADRLGELIVSQRRFVADASHQLRSPLTALRLELEQADASDPDAVQRALHETRRLGRLVDGLLVLARSEGVRLDPTTVDVSRLVEDRVAFWAPVAAEGGVTLTADTRPGVLASAVEGHVDQVLDNLVANALEATDPGGRIRVRTRGPDPVVIEVDDDGPGMSEEARAHAFDRFWRGHGASPGTGSGLGLPIARQLARGSGGELTLGATETGGLRAVVRLPAARQGRR